MITKSTFIPDGANANMYRVDTYQRLADECAKCLDDCITGYRFDILAQGAQSGEVQVNPLIITVYVCDECFIKAFGSLYPTPPDTEISA